ncbi:MAG: translation initiation factor IF-2, partial [Segetibacter sp.]
MLELKLPRLLAAAKEFNVGQDTIVDFLVGKGFNRDELKPTAKLSEDMYRSLQHQFQGDKVAKNKADLVEIPKGVQQESRKKRDEEEITFIKKEVSKPVAQPVAAPETAPVATAESKAAQPVFEKLQPIEQPKQQPEDVKEDGQLPKTEPQSMSE